MQSFPTFSTQPVVQAVITSINLYSNTQLNPTVLSSDNRCLIVLNKLRLMQNVSVMYLRGLGVELQR